MSLCLYLTKYRTYEATIGAAIDASDKVYIAPGTSNAHSRCMGSEVAVPSNYLYSAQDRSSRPLQPWFKLMARICPDQNISDASDGTSSSS